MSSHPVDRLQCVSDPEDIASAFFLLLSGTALFVQAQKQDDDKSHPSKQKPGKPERESGKESQRVKRPKKRIGMPSAPDK